MILLYRQPLALSWNFRQGTAAHAPKLLVVLVVLRLGVWWCLLWWNSLRFSSILFDSLRFWNSISDFSFFWFLSWKAELRIEKNKKHLSFLFLIPNFQTELRSGLKPSIEPQPLDYLKVRRVTGATSIVGLPGDYPSPAGEAFQKELPVSPLTCVWLPSWAKLSQVEPQRQKKSEKSQLEKRECSTMHYDCITCICVSPNNKIQQDPARSSKMNKNPQRASPQFAMFEHVWTFPRWHASSSGLPGALDCWIARLQSLATPRRLIIKSMSKACANGSATVGRKLQTWQGSCQDAFWKACRSSKDWGDSETQSILFFFSLARERCQSIHALLHLFCVGAEAEAFREDVCDNVTMSDFSMLDTVDYMVTSTMILMKNHQSILPAAYKRARRPWNQSFKQVEVTGKNPGSRPILEICLVLFNRLRLSN